MKLALLALLVSSPSWPADFVDELKLRCTVAGLDFGYKNPKIFCDCFYNDFTKRVTYDEFKAKVEAGDIAGLEKLAEPSSEKCDGLKVK